MCVCVCVLCVCVCVCVCACVCLCVHACVCVCVGTVLTLSFQKLLFKESAPFHILITSYQLVSSH